MASKSLTALLNETNWPELDYLMLQYAASTGVHFNYGGPANACQRSLNRATTPQDLALVDATKGIAMLIRLRYPVIGVVKIIERICL